MLYIDQQLKDINTSPTKAQKEAGNYKKGHIRVNGFKITIENPKGSRRYYGEKKYTVMKNHYGYFNGAVGYDGDQVDVFLGKKLDSDKVFVVDQKKTDGSFDESKVMLGFDDKEEAKKAYLSNYSPGWRGFMAITEIDVDKFRKWLYSGKKQRKPFSEYKNLNENDMKNVISLNESDIRRIIKNTVVRALRENKLTIDDDYTYPKRGDEDADLDYSYEKWLNARPSKADWDELYGGAPENDEPDLVYDEIGAAYDKEHPDDGMLIDADDEGEGYSRDYRAGQEYAKNLIAKGKNVAEIVNKLNEKEDDGSITAYELGMLDTLDEF
jgi:hypothetical protein